MQKYTVSGMRCAACSARVEKAVSALPAVSSCAVNLLTGGMTVEGNATDAEIITAVQRAGYDAKSAEPSGQASPADEPLPTDASGRIRRRLIASVLLLVVLMYVSMGHAMFGFPLPDILSDNAAALGFIQMLLTFSILLINGEYFSSGLRAVLHRAPNMDTLVSMGSGVAFGYSVYELFMQITDPSRTPTYYFESSAMILTLITVGKLLESKSKGRTTDALKGLMRLKPQTAFLLIDGKEVTVPIDDVRPDAVFCVHPGERIPVDGVVIQGSSAVDESALTGESIPVEKEAGAKVWASTMNTTGYLRCRATHVGNDTTLSQIIQMVQDASAGKAPIARIADKAAAVFVPVVLGIAAVTVVVWQLVGQTVAFALARGIAVLVISCPCALGLATPVAIMVGSGVGARQGTLFKSAAALEETGKVQIVALDKTGTLTEGKPVVTDVLPADGVSEKELLQYAGALEQNSEHPLSSAILDYVRQNSISIPQTEKFEALPGFGLRAVIDGNALTGGSAKYMQTAEDAQFAALSNAGKTPLYFALNEQPLGCIAVADTLRTDSVEAVQSLQKMGIRVVMLTGDNPQTAEAIAKQAGIRDVIAQLLPGDKEKAVRKLRTEGKVAMVGDGINDAPALTAADIGIAVGSGTDVAVDAADVVLMQNGMRRVPDAIRLSRAVLRKIRQNLFWAFFYNALGIPLAAGAFIPLLHWDLPPMFGAAAMSLSSFFVVTNALRLNRFNPEPIPVEPERQIIQKEITEMEKTLKIEGMMCTHCEMHVKKALEALDPVREAIVSHETGTAVVKLNEEIDDDTLKAAVENEGYKVIG